MKGVANAEDGAVAVGAVLAAMLTADRPSAERSSHAKNAVRGATSAAVPATPARNARRTRARNAAARAAMNAAAVRAVSAGHTAVAAAV